MSQPNLRDIIKSEYKKCIEDPIYFMKKYVKIQHPIRGTVAFAFYPFQEDALQKIEQTTNAKMGNMMPPGMKLPF